jgi:DNA-binding transcriptional LysR family regulator
VYPSVHQLGLFLLPAEELHFGRAARRAFLAQPTLSQQIRSKKRSRARTTEVVRALLWMP